LCPTAFHIRCEGWVLMEYSASCEEDSDDCVTPLENNLTESLLYEK
jgi:hypothetical protein